MRTAIIQLFAIILVFGACAVQAEEAAEAEQGATLEELVESCGACHGKNGDTPLAPEYPLLAGQYKGYLANALRQYRDGQRTNAIMALQVEILELTDANIEELAGYFAAKKSKLHGLAD